MGYTTKNQAVEFVGEIRQIRGFIEITPMSIESFSPNVIDSGKIKLQANNRIIRADNDSMVSDKNQLFLINKYSINRNKTNTARAKYLASKASNPSK